MWTTIVSVPCFVNPTLGFGGSWRTNRSPLNFKASFFDYPLASRIIIKNLPYSTSESRLLEKFSNFGDIAEVKLVQDETTGRSKGFAFIQFSSQDDAMLAIENMDYQNFDGRVINLEVARPGKHTFGGYPITTGPPKQQQQQQQQQQQVPEQEVGDCWY